MANVITSYSIHYTKLYDARLKIESAVVTTALRERVEEVESHLSHYIVGKAASHFASAITAGRLLGLDVAQIAAAQGIAGSTASGIQAFLEEGAWTKRFHPGWGAVAGFTAAQLAKSGFKGPTRPYEGKFGLFETHLPPEAGKPRNNFV